MTMVEHLYRATCPLCDWRGAISSEYDRARANATLHVTDQHVTPTGPTVGELCAGYGGVALALESIWPGARVSWVSDIEKAPSRILAHHYPGVPNHGDLTRIDWASVAPVDILTAGFPCQPVSHAGKRAGLDDERWLFDDILTALRVMDPPPRLCVFENVLGLLTANGGDAMARVVEGLASVGYVGAYRVLAASDVGAPHRRRRVFILAWPEADAAALTWPEADAAALTWPEADARLLPTPAVNDMGAGKTVQAWDEWTEKMRAAHGNGNGHGASLSIEALRLLPTPEAKLGSSGPDYARADRDGTGGDSLHEAVGRLLPAGGSGEATCGCAAWAGYAPAIHRWERALGRPAPSPTEPTGEGGAHRLSPLAVEFMMGLPGGWVTDVPGITRNDQLKALGNGVVPQQAAAALRWLLDVRANALQGRAA